MNSVEVAKAFKVHPEPSKIAPTKTTFLVPNRAARLLHTGPGFLKDL